MNEIAEGIRVKLISLNIEILRIDLFTSGDAHTAMALAITFNVLTCEEGDFGFRVILAAPTLA